MADNEDIFGAPGSASDGEDKSDAVDGKESVNKVDHSQEVPDHAKINEENGIEINHNPHDTSNLNDYKALQKSDEEPSEEEIDKAVEKAAGKHPQANELAIKGDKSRFGLVASMAHDDLEKKTTLRRVVERVEHYFGNLTK